MLTILLIVALTIGLVWTLAYHVASAAVWALVAGLGLIGLTATGILTGAAAGLVWLVCIALAVLASVKSVRQGLLSGPIFRIYKKLLPQMSQTEQEALEAGTVWWDGDLFSGKPDWNKLLDYPAPRLTAKSRHSSTAQPRNYAEWSTSGKSSRSFTTYPRMCGSSSRTRASWA